jgi:hypothetical protein
MNEIILKTTENKEVQVQAFSSMSGFEIAQRMAKALAESDLVPQMYRGKLSNCLVALEISQRCNASVLMVMQNLFVIQGKPGWSSQYIIAALNSCGKFSPLRFKKDTEKCMAYAVELRTNEILEGPEVSIAMAKAEGWFDKNGSKWKTMPELMLMYRSAAFFGRLYAPEVLMGLQTKEEVEDVIETTSRKVNKPDAAIEDLVAKLQSVEAPVVGEFDKFDEASVVVSDPKLVKGKKAPMY